MTSYETGGSKANDKKTIKFHGDVVANVVVLYSSTQKADADASSASGEIKTFDAAQAPLADCETINIQVVSDFVTITFYREEKANSIIRRELIPSHRVERILIEDLKH